MIMERTIAKGQVTRKEIRFNKPYYKISNVPSDMASDIGVNLYKLVNYIGRNSNLGRKTVFGNAQLAIRNEARRYGRFRFSKREVKSLFTCYYKKDGTQFIKVPYKSYDLFKAIFAIVNRMKDKYPMDHDLEIFLGEIRGKCFYREQLALFEASYHAAHNLNSLSMIDLHLRDDLFSDYSPLKKEF